MWNKIKAEPALVVGLVQAVLALLVAFGFDLSDGQVAAVLAVAGAALAVLVRQSVTPNVKIGG